MRLSEHTYRTISTIAGPPLFVEQVQAARIGEVVRVVMPDGSTTDAEVLEIDEKTVLVEVYGTTQGLDLERTTVTFTDAIKKVPLSPMGGGLTLSGICRPLRGGIVLDMKRMNRILEVNETSCYAVVEAGVSQGMLQAYLKEHHPRLKHSVPDAPPIATIGGNVLIHGSGHLSAAGGFHSEMLNGLEASHERQLPESEQRWPS